MSANLNARVQHIVTVASVISGCIASVCAQLHVLLGHYRPQRGKTRARRRRISTSLMRGVQGGKPQHEFALRESCGGFAWRRPRLSPVRCPV